MTRKKTPAAEDVPEALEPMAEEQTQVAETLSGEGTDVHPEETGTMELAAETSESPEGRVDWPLAGPAPHRNPACGFSAPGSLQG